MTARGASPARAQAWPVAPDELPECPICLEEMEAANCVELECAHTFHLACAWGWAQVAGSCAYCRRPMTLGCHMHMRVLHLLRMTTGRGAMWDSVRDQALILVTTQESAPRAHAFLVHGPPTPPPVVARKWWHRFKCWRARATRPVSDKVLFSATRYGATLVHAGPTQRFTQKDMLEDSQQRRTAGDANLIVYMEGPVVCAAMGSTPATSAGDRFHMLVPSSQLPQSLP